MPSLLSYMHDRYLQAVLGEFWWRLENLKQELFLHGKFNMDILALQYIISLGFSWGLTLNFIFFLSGRCKQECRLLSQRDPWWCCLLWVFHLSRDAHQCLQQCTDQGSPFLCQPSGTWLVIASILPWVNNFCLLWWWLPGPKVVAV